MLSLTFAPGRVPRLGKKPNSSTSATPVRKAIPDIYGAGLNGARASDVCGWAIMPAARRAW